MNILYDLKSQAGEFGDRAVLGLQMGSQIRISLRARTFFLCVSCVLR